MRTFLLLAILAAIGIAAWDAHVQREYQIEQIDRLEDALGKVQIRIIIPRQALPSVDRKAERDT